MSKDTAKMQPLLDTLNEILEAELSGVVRYTHYALMIFGYNRIPIVKWLRDQATESLDHANEAGELITHFGAHPSLKIAPLLESHEHDIGSILRESLNHEGRVLALYKKLATQAEGVSIMVEEYARRMVETEERHSGEVNKMLRAPGQVKAFEE